MSYNLCNRVKVSSNVLFCAFKNEILGQNVKESYGIFHIVARNFMTGLCLQRAKHYDSLGLTPRATQTEIKSAYYKLSMLYHPDRNQDAEAAQKFRDITEAYEVLGNVSLKKLYDRGVLGNEINPLSAARRQGTRQSAPATEDDPKMKFYQKHAFKEKIPTMDGTASSSAYNFDEWSKTHYSKTFKKMHTTHGGMAKNAVPTQTAGDLVNLEKVLAVLAIGGAAIIIFSGLKTQNDEVRKK